MICECVLKGHWRQPPALPVEADGAPTYMVWVCPLCGNTGISYCCEGEDTVREEDALLNMLVELRCQATDLLSLAMGEMWYDMHERLRYIRDTRQGFFSTIEKQLETVERKTDALAM